MTNLQNKSVAEITLTSKGRLPLVSSIWHLCRGRFLALALALAVSYSLSSQQFINVADDLGISALPEFVFFGSGLSFYDFNGDGLDDLSFTMTNDSLVFYQNTGEGFELLPSPIYADGEAKCLLWVDYDNDGDLDLFLSINDGRYKLYQNDGDFNFTDVSDIVGLSLANERHYGASFADYNKDGYLDFYVCTYAFDAGPVLYDTYNHLYKNNGDGTFTDVTEEAGVEDGVRLSFQSVWLDYDHDGWLDLFVINDRLFSNSLYKNNGDGTFEDVSAEAGIQFPGQDPMTATVGDFDNDGDLDIYMTNTGVTGKLPKLLVNNGDGTFTDMAASHNVTFPYWSWGAVWADFDNDGLQDLYATTSNPSSLVPPVTNQAFQQTGNGLFLSAGFEFENDSAGRYYSAVRGDFNNDGYFDIATLGRAPHDVRLWENQGGSHAYIKITLAGTASNSHAIGSWIKVYAGENTYTQFTHCGENYLSQNSQHHIFGLGISTEVDSVVVTYPSGHSDAYYDLEANHHHYLTEGDTYGVALEASPGTQVCEGQSVTLSAGAHEAYLWSDGSEESTLEVTESGTYAVTTFNAFGVAATDSITVVVSPEPNILESTTHPTCADAENGTIQLQNQAGPAPMAVTWEHGAEGLELDSLPAGVYTYLFTDINGCTLEGTVALSAPSPITAEVFTIMETNGGDGSLLVLASGGTPPYTITINGEEAPGGLLENLESGIYLVVITDAAGCTSNLEATIGSLSASHSEADEGIQLYPNPASTFLLIDTGEMRLTGPVTIYSLDGKIVAQHLIQGAKTTEIALDMAHGLYILTLDAGGKRYFQKFTKTNAP